jgi:hypothetical protein
VPDWESLVRQRLAGLALGPEQAGEVIAELAAHLEENYQDLRRQGIDEEESMRRTLSQVKDWRDLQHSIQSARRKENMISNRVAQFWLPSLLTLFSSMGLLMLIQVFGPNLWTVTMRSGWSLIAPTAMVYLPWLFLLPVIGAMGAYLSNRAGSSRRAMRFSIIFPVLPYSFFFLVALPVTAIFNDHLGHNIMFLALFVGLLAWVVAPAGALLAGGLLAEHFISRRLHSRRLARS